MSENVNEEAVEVAADNEIPKSDPAAASGTGPSSTDSAGPADEAAFESESEITTTDDPRSDAALLTGSARPSENEETSQSASASATGPPDAPGRQRSDAGFGLWRRWISYRSSRDFRRGLRSLGSRDDKENAEGRLPDRERVEVPVVWVCELYTPSTVRGLLDGIARLGWGRGRSQSDDLAKWMNDVRNGRSAGWTSLGYVSPSDAQHVMSKRTAALPPGVDAAFPALMSITPSVTALVMAFQLDAQAASTLDEALRADFHTYTTNDPLYRRRHVLRYVIFGEPMRTGQTIHYPSGQRRDEVRKRLRETEASCTDWVRSHLPGVFAADLREGRFPTALLLLTDQARPLTDDSRGIRAFEGPGLDRSFDAWESDEWPNVRMTVPLSWDEEELRLLFSCRRRDAFPPAPGYGDLESNWTIAQRANDLIPHLLTRWALSCLLDGYHQLLSRERDRSAGSSSYRAVRDLRGLRTLLRNEAYDLQLSAAEVSTFVESPRDYDWNVMEMRYARSLGSQKPELLSSLRSAQAERARQVEAEAGLLLDVLTKSNDLTQTISNIRIQRFLTALTLLSIVTAVVAILVAIQAGSH